MAVIYHHTTLARTLISPNRTASHADTSNKDSEGDRVRAVPFLRP